MVVQGITTLQQIWEETESCSQSKSFTFLHSLPKLSLAVKEPLFSASTSRLPTPAILMLVDFTLTT